jgi:hypothetical protein
MGKALVGLDQYGEAVVALSTALKLKKNNKEIRDALQVASLKYFTLSIIDIMQSFSVISLIVI